MVVTGIPGAGTTTVSRLLAARFPRGVRIHAGQMEVVGDAALLDRYFELASL